MKYWLLITLMYPGQDSRWATGVFPDLEQCLKALNAAQIVIPTGTGKQPPPKDGKTWAGMKVCVPVATTPPEGSIR